ncbi:MAG: hypothetical protein KGR26_09835 [Cyanobacteria bacterium REEB65]|nr:hypothetical protein [Cyanobacteria bacterium REEB65]
MGCSSKLTPEVQETICKYLRAGNTFRTSCEVAGVAANTGREWIARGEERHSARDGDEDYAAFAVAVRKSEEEAIARNVALIQKVAADGTWQAAAWFLERKAPTEWGWGDRHALVRADGQPQQLGDGRC